MKHILAMSLIGLSVPATASVDDVSGIWLTQKKDAQVRIFDCGNGTPCGKLSWVNPKSTDTIYDARNPSPSQKTRKLVGVPIIWGFRTTDNGWHGGKIYNPEDGKTFRSSMRLLGSKKLEVKGCFGPFCRTNVWTRISQ